MFLAALLAIGSLKSAIVVQALLGAGTAVLIALAARRWYGPRAGLLSGLIYAFYGPAVYVDTAILSEGLLLFLLALAIWALSRPPLDWRAAALAGGAFGAAALVRPTALVIAAACLAWLLWQSLSRDRRTATAFAVACLLILAPALAKNYAASGSLSIQGYGGLNAYIGNSPQHYGRATFRLGAGWDALNSEAARAGVRGAAAQDRYYLSKVWREITAQPLVYLRLLGTKALWLVQAEEARDSHSYYFFTEQSSLLRVLPRWWLLFPLAVIGLGIAANPLLLSYLAGAAASVVLLVAGFRYRMPLVPGLAIAAGAGLDLVVNAVALKQRRALAFAAALGAAAAAASHLASDPRNVNLAEEWAFTGSALVTERKLDEAEAACRRALEQDPQSGLAWDGLGLALFNSGRLTDARRAFDRAIAIDPDSARAIYHLAVVDEREGRFAPAADGYQRAIELSPFDTEISERLANSRRQLATELGMSGRSREARDLMRKVVELSPLDGEAWLDLCLLSLDAGDVPAAADALRRARELGANPARVQFAAEALAKVER